MAQFKPAKITSQGQLMMMQDLKGELDLQFTRIVFGSGEYTEEEYATITARTALKTQKQSFNINSMGILNKNSLLLGVVANNEGLNEGYSMTEIGLYARNANDNNASEHLYAIVIAENGCADFMPPYNGSSTVRIRQNFQVDVVDASTVTLEVTDSAVVSQSFLEEFYYNKAQANNLLDGKMNYSVLDTVSTISALNEIATNSEYADGNFTLIIPIGSGNIMANLDIAVCETAIMTFHGDYPILYFPYNNKKFRYSDSATYKWVRVYADVNPSDSVVAAMIDARHSKPKHTYMGIALASATVPRNTAVSDQITNNAVGRLYISGTDFIEYADLESTEGVELTTENEPSDNYYIQTWHRADGSIWQRTKIGDSGTPSVWSEIAATTAT